MALATSRSAHFLPVGISSTFDRYVEFDEPCWIETTSVTGPPGAGLVVVTGTQDGRQVFRSTVTVQG